MPHPSHFTPGKEFQYPWQWRLVEPSRPVWTDTKWRKSLVPTGVQTVDHQTHRKSLY